MRHPVVPAAARASAAASMSHFPAGDIGRNGKLRHDRRQTGDTEDVEEIAPEHVAAGRWRAGPASIRRHIPTDRAEGVQGGRAVGTTNAYAGRFRKLSTRAVSPAWGPVALGP